MIKKKKKQPLMNPDGTPTQQQSDTPLCITSRSLDVTGFTGCDSSPSFTAFSTFQEVGLKRGSFGN